MNEPAAKADGCLLDACRTCTGCAHSQHATCRGVVTCPTDKQTRPCRCCGHAHTATEERAVVYALGFVMCSACAPAVMSREDVERSVNTQHPTAISSAWTVSSEPFLATEKMSPTSCNTDAGRRHWLLSC